MLLITIVFSSEFLGAHGLQIQIYGPRRCKRKILLALSRKYFEQISKRSPTTTMSARLQLYIIGSRMPLGGQKRFGLFKERVDRGRIRHSYSRPNTEVRGGGEGANL